jgi:hypothetical protein
VWERFQHRLASVFKVHDDPGLSTEATGRVAVARDTGTVDASLSLEHRSELDLQQQSEDSEHEQSHSDPGAACRYVIYINAQEAAKAESFEEALDLLESLLHFQAAQAAREYVFIHAGVVAWEGRAIVLPGRSMSGKTSLVAALIGKGATYYSDEYTVLDKDGYVHPYPKDLSLRTPIYRSRLPDMAPTDMASTSVASTSVTMPAVRTETAGVECTRTEIANFRLRRTPQQLNGSVGSKPLPVGLIAALTYDPCSRWRPRMLSRGQGMLTMLENTVLARHQPALSLAVLQRVAQDSLAIEGWRGEAEHTATLLLELLKSASRGQQT